MINCTPATLTHASSNHHRIAGSTPIIVKQLNKRAQFKHYYSERFKLYEQFLGQASGIAVWRIPDYLRDLNSLGELHQIAVDMKEDRSGAQI